MLLLSPHGGLYDEKYTTVCKGMQVCGCAPACARSRRLCAALARAPAGGKIKRPAGAQRRPKARPGILRAQGRALCGQPIRLSPQAKQRAAGNMPRGAARFCGCLTAQRPAKYRCRAGPLKPPRSALCRPCEAGTPPKRLPHRLRPPQTPPAAEPAHTARPWRG